MLCSLSESAFRVAATGADTALYNFEIYFSKMNLSFIDTFLKNFLKILWTGKDHLITSPGHINILLPHPVSFFSSCEMQG